MKKYIAIFLAFLICTCFVSCANQKSNQEIEEPTLEVLATTENSETHTNIDITTDFVSSEADSSQNLESSSKAFSTELLETTEKETVLSTTEKATTEKNSSAVTTTKKSTVEKETVNSLTTTESTTKKTQSTTNTTISTTKTQTTTQTTTTTTTKPANEVIECSVKIECTKILQNKKKFTDDISLVPQNGVILSATTVTVKEGSTAYDAIKKACSQNGVSVNEKNSSFGVYIVGFNDIDEKECGAYSGWLYSVNGTMPNVGVDKYVLNNGDNIVLSYTC